MPKTEQAIEKLAQAIDLIAFRCGHELGSTDVNKVLKLTDEARVLMTLDENA